uniref:Ig-like domain-containing protein n=1 Tax=Leptobrachium leishanense TaxID=445787 RepID=A0A8C5M3W3_9ANUR
MLLLAGILFFPLCLLASDLPQTPSISPNPSQPVYIRGETITLICSSPDGSTVSGVKYFKNNEKIHTGDTPLLILSTITSDVSGNYSCMFWDDKGENQTESSISDTVSIRVIDPPSSPSISLTPSYPVYIRGEKVTVICSLPVDFAVNGIKYYRNGSEVHAEKILVIPTVTNGDAGIYYCIYQETKDGRTVMSSPSNTVTIRVIDPLGAPSIALNPSHPVYINGEMVTVTCSSPIDSAVKNIKYFRNGADTSTEEILVIPEVTHEHAGNYSCEYKEMRDGRTITSPFSNIVIISVVDPLRAPSITLNPSHPVYISGEKVNVTCSSPSDSAASSITYYRNGRKNSNEEILVISSVAHVNAGNYSCEYKEMKNGRTIKSPISNTVIISVVDQPPSPSISLNPTHPVYVIGEMITILCSPLAGSAVSGIKIYSKKQKSDSKDRLVIPKVTHSNAGDYFCLYQEMKGGRTITSLPSNTVTVHVIDPLPVPTLEEKSHKPIYLLGDDLYLICSASSLYYVTHIHIYRNNEYVAHVRKDQQFSLSYNITSLQKPMCGSYSCQYSAKVSGREIQSPKSNSLHITLTDPLPFPTLEEKSHKPIYLLGDDLYLICSASSLYYVTHIHIYRNNEDVAHVRKDQQFSLSYNITSLQKPMCGSYSCQYSAKVSGREIQSPKSNSLHITLTDLPSPPLLSINPNHSMYVNGEKISLLCNAGFEGALYIVYKNGKPIDLKYLFTIKNDSGGSYTCSYKKNIKERLVESNNSVPVIFTVIEPPPPPNITFDSPVQKVEDRFQVTLNCSISIPDSNISRSFYFIRADVDNKSRNTRGVSASLVWDLEPVENALFYCEYEVEISGRNVRSARSNMLIVPLTEASFFSSPVIAGIIGGLALLICLIMILTVYIRNKKGNRKNSLRFSWYWKEKQSQHKIPSPRPKSPLKNAQEPLECARISRAASINLSELSITEKDEDASHDTMNFSTFQLHKRNNEEDLCSWAGQSEA